MTDERSESPTPRRRRLAREQGQVARSHDLAAAFGFIAAIAAFAICGPPLLRLMMGLLRDQLSNASMTHGDTTDYAETIQRVGFQVILQLLPLLALICAAVAIAHLAQTGFLWLPNKVLPDLRNIDFMRGFQRLANPGQIGRLLFQTVKVVLIVIVAGLVMRNQLPQVLQLGANDTAMLFQDSLHLFSRFAIVIGITLLSFGVLDYAIQRWKHEQHLRMTPEQLREEVKAIRGLGRGRANNRDSD